MCNEKPSIVNEKNLRTALVMDFSDPCSTPRPRRMIQLLNFMGFGVDVLSRPASGSLGENRVFHLSRPPKGIISKVFLRIRLHFAHVLQSLFWPGKIYDYLNDFAYGIDRYRKDILESAYCLIVVENLPLLPLAFRIKGNAKILFDAREYYPKQREHSLYFRLFERPERTRLCRTYLPKCDQVITVSPGLAAKYKQEFGISPTVVMSVPQYHEGSPRKTDPGHIKMVYHGGASPNRRLENMIEIVKLLDDRFTMDFYLTGSPSHIADLKACAKGVSRVRFHKPVPFAQIIPMLTNYDIGLYLLQPTGFNVTYNLPNKFFEFIQARLMVAIGPSPDMADIVRHYNCGVVADSFSIRVMADSLSRLNVEQIHMAKENSHLAAKELCFEKEQGKLQEIIGALVSFT